MNPALPRTQNPRSPAAIGHRLGLFREALGLTAAQLCREIGLAENTWSQWEIGKRNPDKLYIYKLVDTYGVTLDWIYLGNPAGLPYQLASKLVRHPHP
jgi:transcriptional regulator with XRE-family HTH domain